MVKVLYLCHGFQNSGWGRASRDNILALDSAGVDVAWRPIRLNGDIYSPTGRYLELLEKDIDDCDYCIQHVLPNYLTYNGNFKKNIAYFVAETLDWNYSGFYHNINLMDQLWCPNQEMAENSEKFIKIPIGVIPHPCDPTKYSKEYKTINVPELESGYNFYFIGEWNKRKRIGAIIQAFNLEFKKTEPVNLVIKTHKHGVPPQKLGQEIFDLSRSIKEATKLYKDQTRYPHEIIISSFLSEEEVMGLHQACHCIINTSYGESWSYPSFDAMAFGNAVISPKIGGMADFLSGYNWGFTLRGEYKPVFGMEKENFSNYNSSKEKWHEANVNELRFLMRECYNGRVGVGKNRDGLREAKKFSYEKVGNFMKGLLYDSSNQG